MFNLSGQRALITGSSRGIGLAVARALGRHGAMVVVNGRHHAAVDDAAARLRAEGIDASSLVFDIEDVEASLRAVDTLLAETGPVNILVANAGIQHREALTSYPMHQFERVLHANLTAQWALGRHIAAGMVSAGYGRIIFTGSVTALRGRAGVTAYTAAKAALHGLVRQWTAELGPHNITVNAIAPGYIQTNLTEALSSDARFTEWLDAHVPAGGWGAPDDIASTAVFLAAPESRFVSGQIIAVDGGLSATLM